MSGLLSSLDISASGLAAERIRMEVVANNIANAQSTHSDTGEPYQRRIVTFESALNQQLGKLRPNSLGGVRVVNVVGDQSPFPEVFNPSHPDADDRGFVAMPNVHVASEMVDLITASRAYEANLNALRTFQDMTEETLALLRSLS